MGQGAAYQHPPPGGKYVVNREHQLFLVDSRCMATLVDLLEDMGDHLKVHPQVLIQLYGAGFRFVLHY